MNRRGFFMAVSAGLAASGCGNSIMSRTVATAFGNSFGGVSAFSPDYPDTLPYASIAVTLKNNPRALLILARIEQGECHWMSSDRSVLVTRNGRLVRTVGLPQNLVGTTFLRPDFFGEGRLLDGGRQSAARMVDLAPGGRFGVVVEANLSSSGPEKIQILARSHDTFRLEERCVAPRLSWEFTNTYWVDSQGFVWRSIQHIAPETAPIEIEVTKPLQA